MKTVKQLREELAKFDDEMLCYAYEGEQTGIVIVHPNLSVHDQGFIPCSESRLDSEPTRVFPRISR